MKITQSSLLATIFALLLGTQLAWADSPTAVDISVTIDEDNPVTFTVLSESTSKGKGKGKKAKQTPSDLSLVDITDPDSGSAVINADGTITYTPAPDFFGDDAFTYTISNDEGTDTGDIIVTVNPVNDDPVAGNNEAWAVQSADITIDVLANDSDVDNPHSDLSIKNVRQASGVVHVNADGTLSYNSTPRFSGDDVFTYTVIDGSGGSASGTVTVHVTLDEIINNDPVADDQSVTTDEDVPVAITLTGSDVDEGDVLTFEVVDGPTHGSLTGAAPDLTYAPEADYNGGDSFTFRVSDGQGGTATGTVSISLTAVNDPPAITSPATANAVEDELFTYTATATDVDNATVTFTFSDLSTWLAVDGDNMVTGSPTEGITSGSFHITASDGDLTDELDVTITVGAVNDPPVAVNDEATTDEDTPVTVDVLTNDSDPDGNPLTIAVVSDPAHGSATTDGSTVTYTPDADFNGNDGFTYTVSDGNGGSATATVTIDVTPVNDAPVAVDDNFTTPEDTPRVLDVLDNDDDVDGDDLIITHFAQANGIVHISDDGKFLNYSPTPNFSGVDEFFYNISDGHGGTAEGTVTVRVAGVNDPPLAVDDAASTLEDTPVTINVMRNDSDPDGDPLTLDADLVTQPGHGTAQIDGDSSFTYTPDADYNGPDSFTYRVSDDQGSSAAGTVSITVSQVNDAPQFTSSPVTAATEGTPYSYNITAGDVDKDAVLSISATTLPGWLTFTDNGDGTALLSGVPDNDDVGDHPVVLALTDGIIATPVVQSFTTTVTNVNDAPLFTSSPVTAATEGIAYSYNITASDVDNDAVLSISATTLPGWLTFTDNGDGTALLSGVPDNDDVGDHPVVLALTDGIIATPVVQSFTTTVTNVNDAPLAIDDSASTGQDTPVTINVLRNDADPDGDALALQSVTSPSHGAAQISGDSTVTYTPEPNFTGTDTFTYTVSDGHDGGTDTGTVTVTVNLDAIIASATIDSAGGNVAGLGASIEVPAGALDTLVDIQIGLYLDPPSDLPPGVFLSGPIYFYGPSGTEFGIPVAITVPYDPDTPNLDVDRMVLLQYNEDTQTWEVITPVEVNEIAYTISGLTNHFSGFAAGWTPNRAPVNTLAILGVTVDEDAAFITLVDSLPNYFADPDDGDVITFTVNALDEGLDTLFITQSLSIIAITSHDFFGDVRTEVTATDPLDASVSVTFVLTVTPVNDAPFFANIPVITLGEDEIAQIPLSSLASDIEGDSLSFTASSDTSALEAVVGETMLLLIPAPNWHGTANIALSVSDGQATQRDTLAVTVTEAPDIPTTFSLLEPGNNTTIQITPAIFDDSLLFAWETSTDPDGDPVTYLFTLSDDHNSFEYGDTSATEVRVPYADIMAALRDQGLVIATFSWNIVAISGVDSVTAADGPFQVTIDMSTLAVADNNQLPQLFALHQNYPNPFNPITTIRYELPAQIRVLLVIYDMRGKEVVTLVDGYEGAGFKKVIWNSSDAAGRPVPTGLYFARIVTSAYTHTIKMTLIK